MGTIKELGGQLGDYVRINGARVQIVGLVPEGNGEAPVTYIYPPVGRGWIGHTGNTHRYWPETGEIEHTPITALGSRPEDTVRLQGLPLPDVEPAVLEGHTFAQYVHGGYRLFERARVRQVPRQPRG